jgi:hypothetical protein
LYAVNSLTQIKKTLSEPHYERKITTNPSYFIHKSTMFFFCLLDVIQKLSVLSSDSEKMLGTLALAPETVLDRLHQQKKCEILGIDRLSCRGWKMELIIVVMAFK